MAALPDEVDPGVTRREVTPASPRTAAWGEPAVLLRCGVPLPERFSDPVTVNGVEWNVRFSGGTTTWVSLGRAVPVEVVVPDEYPNAGEIVNPIAVPVRDLVPEV